MCLCFVQVAVIEDMGCAAIVGRMFVTIMYTSFCLVTGHSSPLRTEDFLCRTHFLGKAGTPLKLPGPDRSGHLPNGTGRAIELYV